jgi:hypothetical protein
MNAPRIIPSFSILSLLLACAGTAGAASASSDYRGSHDKPAIDSDGAVPLVKHYVKVCDKKGKCKWKLVYKGKGIP